MSPTKENRPVSVRQRKLKKSACVVFVRPIDKMSKMSQAYSAAYLPAKGNNVKSVPNVYVYRPIKIYKRISYCVCLLIKTLSTYLGMDKFHYVSVYNI